MPIVRRSTVRAVTRSTAAAPFSASKTLVPFLYQTPTIQQQWPPATSAQYLPRRNLASSSGRDRDAPIQLDDDDYLPPTVEETKQLRAAAAKSTTVTQREREAFEKLYQKYAKETKGKELRQDDTDRIADEWYEEDDDNNGKPEESLDELFDAVLAGLPQQKSTPRIKPKKPAENMASLAKDILKPEMQEAKQKSREQAIEAAAQIKATRKEERSRIKSLMASAKTDRELWAILEREVLDKIRKLDLDGMKKSIRRQATSATVDAAQPNPDTASDAPAFPTAPTTKPWKPSKVSSDPGSDPRILFPNFPSHLLTAASTLHKSFPASPLPYLILPTLKSLGRSTYALGATARLYNILIRAAWSQYSSYDYIDELLTEMDNSGIEFDENTLQLLEDICAEYHIARKGRLGNSLQIVYKMEGVGEGIKKVDVWRRMALQRFHGAVGGEAKKEVIRARKGPERRPHDRRARPEYDDQDSIPLVQ